MSAWDWVTATGEFFTKGAETIRDVAEVAAAAGSIYTSIKQAEYAEDLADMQAAEAQRVADLEEARAKREARIKAAQIKAAQGSAGVTASTAEAGIIGIGTDLQSGLEDLTEATQFNINQFNLKASDASTKAFSDIVTGTFSAIKPTLDIASTFAPKEPEINVPDYLLRK